MQKKDGNRGGMGDDWKGEALIRNVRKDNGEAKRIANILFHERRRADSAPPAGHRAHQFFFRNLKNDR
jgi:hypothetical protein